MNNFLNRTDTLWNFLQMDLKRAFFNWRFLLASVIMWLLMWLSILPIVLFEGRTATWDYLFQYAEFSDFRLVYYMCAVFPYACAFLEDYWDGYGIFLLSRGLKEKYALSKCLAVILSACGAFVVVYFSFFAAVRIIFPDSIDKSMSAYVRDFCTLWLEMGGGLVYVICRGLLAGFVSSMLGLIVLTASIYLHDVLIINALPLLVFFIISNLSTLLNLPENIDLYIITMGNPAIGTDLVNYLYSMGVILLIIILVSKLFIKLVKERVWV